MFHPKGPSIVELARQALSDTTQGYDLLARKFDYTPFRTPPELLAPMAAQLAEKDQPPIARALDLCCGTGAAMLALRPLCTEEIVGVDLSQGMLDMARESLERQQQESATALVPFKLIQQDALQLDFQQSFDVITCCGAFGHIMPPEQDRFVERIHDALKQGGRFVFITHLKPSAGSLPWVAARGFNAVMHVRNALFPEEFVMFYLTFYLERAVDVLSRHGFSIEISAPYQRLDYGRKMRLVTATKK